MKNKLLIVSALVSAIGLTYVDSDANAQNRRGASTDNMIYKYFDSKGNPVYSDKLPADEKGEFSLLSSRSGMIKEVVEGELSKEEVEDLIREKEETKIIAETKLQSDAKDKALLVAYSSVSDIDKLRDYELEQIDLGIKNNIDNLATLKDAINRLEENYSLDPDNENIKLDLDKANNDLAIVQETLDANKEMYAERERKYAEDKKRYLEILEEKKE